VIDEQQTEKPRGTFWRELPILIGVAVLVAFLVRTFVLQTFWIPSQSMEHTLNIKDRVLVNKLVYDFREPRRGEIIVFKAPEDWQSGEEGQDFIKRIIGVGGDHVVCCDDQQRLMVNGHAFDEPFVYANDAGEQDPAGSQPFDITVPAGRLWVMGDHRSESADSLAHWTTNGKKDIGEATITEKAVIGRAFVIFWPVGRTDWLSVPEQFDGIPDAAKK
jgi:signal peptidase I